MKYEQVIRISNLYDIEIQRVNSSHFKQTKF